MGEESGGGGEGGGGKEATYRNRYLISDLSRCWHATNDGKPD